MTTETYTIEEAIALVMTDGWLIRNLPIELRDDKNVVLAAVTQYGQALQYTSDELKNDKDVVLAAVTQDGWALEYASAALQNDKDMVLAAVTTNGWALQYTSEKLKNDKDVVLAAVTKNGNALKFSSPKLKDDREVVLAAVLQEDLLWHASTRLQRDPVLNFIKWHKDFISEIDWPVVLKALLERPDYFLNPEPYIQALADGMDNPYLMLAQYALNKDVNIEPSNYPEIEF